MRSLSQFFLIVAATAFVISPVSARSFRVAQIPNGSVLNCSACHVNAGGGGTRNAFGQLVERSFLVGDNVQWSPLLAGLDADGDGVSNGVELQDRFGQWQTGNPNPGNAAQVTHPADAASNPLRTLTVQFSNMDPHVGQMLELRIVDKSTGLEAGRAMVSSISGGSFNVAIPTAVDGRSYWVDFFADVNRNGFYDPPPTDHAWRISADVSGATSVSFMHNTNFTDIQWVYAVTLNAQGMTPHQGQLFELRVVDSNTGMEVGRKRVEIVPGANFSVMVPGIMRNGNYDVDFYADLNRDDRYSGTPTDHAWRLSFANTTGDVTLDFSHNTSFTDVMWEYLFQINMLSMNPHLGQLFELRVVDQSSDTEIGRTSLPEVAVANYTVSVPGMALNGSYRADFYADLNGNGTYDAPPTDHAWRQLFQNPAGNAVVNFSHNTNFTDIGWPVLAADDPVAGSSLPEAFALEQNYPNPFNPSTNIAFDLAEPGLVRLSVFNILGEHVAELARGPMAAGRHLVSFDGSGLATGMYVYRLEVDGWAAERRMMLTK
ncbi:T9SS type A sorting domain-containing protein [bacterium]|nr:T9SS type A sorting domain-containing protein [bacterium]